MYKQFVLLVKPEDRHLICEKMVETASDELNDHYRSLVQFAVDNKLEFPANYVEMKKLADREDVRDFESCKSGKDAMFYVEKAIASEERAIESYKKVLDDYQLVNINQDFKLIAMNAYYDEVQHLKDFTFIKDSIETIDRSGIFSQE